MHNSQKDFPLFPDIWSQHGNTFFMKDGVMVGSDRNQEWLLSWWWKQYLRHNNFPVAFVDFGLSSRMKKWCAKRGGLIPLPPFFAKEREEVAPLTAKLWERRYGENFWTSRTGWFNKPFACQASPFQRTIWIDLDCEILGSLKKAFGFCEHSSGVAIGKDAVAPSYNSGVIVFQKEASLIREWAAQSHTKNDLFRGDQDLLSQIIADKNIIIQELPSIYNWPVGCGDNPHAIICHWIGEMGKAALRQRIFSDEHRP